MKPRRIIVTIEMDAKDKLSELRNKCMWQDTIDCGAYFDALVIQVQANIVKLERGGAQP